MKRVLLMSLAVVAACPGLGRGQASGNVAYSADGGRHGGKAGAQQREREKRVLTAQELPPSGTSMFVEANVLMNVKADEHVAVFGIAREGETVEECGRKMDTTVKEFSDALRPLGVVGDDLFVDFVTQNKVYGFEVVGEVVREKQVGFELKKNVSIRFKELATLDKFVVAAARSQVFDLIEVDYVVKDTNRVHDQLAKEAARVIKQKVARYEDLLGTKLRPPAQVYAERSAVHFPTDLYDSYVAHESEQVSTAHYRNNLTVQSARKGRTFYFNGLDADGFDDVINPVVLAPVVQFTLYLKVRYEIEPTRAK